MNETELKEGMDKVYKVGLKNGGILMKNKILKKINTSQTLWFSKGLTAEGVVAVMKFIDKIK